MITSREWAYWLTEPKSARRLNRRELTEQLLKTADAGIRREQDLQRRLDRLEKLLNVRTEALVVDTRPDRLDRLETELAKTREALGHKVEQTRQEIGRAEQLIASHEGIEHEGLNKGLVEALIFDQGMDPYSALALLRENKGKTE